MNKSFEFKINNIKAVIRYAGQGKLDGWNFFRWYIEMNNETFEFKTGLAWQVVIPEIEYDPNSTLRKAKNEGKIIYTDSVNSRYLVVPQPKDFMPCLIEDSQCSEMSFEDFCSEFGYDTDSIKAFRIYQDCSEIGKKLKKIFKPEELKDLLNKYSE